MAAMGLVKVAVSVTSLDPTLTRRMEPRAPHPRKRLAAIRALSDAGIPVMAIMAIMAPIILSLNDHEIESLLKSARQAGAREASYVLLRLPHELEALVGDWFEAHYPGRKRHVFGLLRQARGGKAYDAAFGTRMIGEGAYAALIGGRFQLATCRLGYPQEKPRLRIDLFRRPERSGGQLTLL